MVGMLIKVAIGLVLFVGSLVGGLAATGRLNHEGTANIPVLSAFFPEPEKKEGEVQLDEHGNPIAAPADAHAAPGGETANAMHAGEAGVAEASGGEQEPKKPNPHKVGRSVLNPVEPKADGHGGGHGADAGGHGADAGGHGEEESHGDEGHATEEHAADHGHEAAQDHGAQNHMTPAERDFDNMQRALRSQGKTGYQPGALFRFEGMPSGLTPEQLNEAWQRVEGVMQEYQRRSQALDLREQELGELADDISRRWKELGEERLQIEQMQRALDAKIAKFQETVILVRDDEVTLLKRNAETLAAFERSKAAELVQQRWQTETGQADVLKLLEYVDKDAVNEILAELPNALVQDIMNQRLRVSKPAKASGKRN